MLLPPLHFLLFSLLPPHSFSASTFPLGGRASVAVPSVYQPGFVGRAFVIDVGNPQPAFRAAVSVEVAGDGRYSCAVVVLLGDFKVWASDHGEPFVPAGSCVLELTGDGDLQLTDTSHRLGWCSGTSGLGVQSLQLKSTGDLILADGKNQTKWQSFDRPTHTILWGQQLSSFSRLTSSSPFNSSPFYSLEVLQDKIAAYLNCGGHAYSYWELRPQARRSIAFVKLGSKGLKVFGANSSKIAQLLAPRPAAVRFLNLGRNGNVGLYYYSPSDGKFEAAYRALEFCELPLPCVPYGICSSGGTCAHLPLASETEASADFCGLTSSEVDMMELEGVATVLQTSSPMVNVTREECSAACLGDCWCASAFYSEGELCFRYGLVGGAREVENGGGRSSYWIKVQKRSRGRRERTSSSVATKVLIVGGVIDAVALCVMLTGLVYYCFKIRKRAADSGRSNN